MGVAPGPKQVEVTDLLNAVVADGNGSIPYIVEVAVTDEGANTDHDITLTRKSRVIDVWVVKTGGAGTSSNRITVKNTADAITDAIDHSVADKVVVGVGTIDDAQNEIPEGGTLRVTLTTGTGDDSCKVYILLLPIS